MILFSVIFMQVDAYGIQQWDDDTEKSYAVTNFDQIYLDGGYKVILEQSNKCSLRIKADEETIENIEVVNDRATSRLTITKKHFSLDGITLYITFVDLKELHLDGGITLETKGYLDVKALSVFVSGGASVEMELKADSVILESEGGAYFDFKGVANSLNARISGAGFLDAEMLETMNVVIYLEGVGTANVNATRTLNASIEGIGKITYKGNPRVKKNVEGIGAINDH